MLKITKSFDAIHKSRLILKILNTLGLWAVDGADNRGIKNYKIPTMPPIFTRLLIQIPMTFMFAILMWLELLFSSDLTQAVDVLYICLTSTALMIKIINAWYYSALAKSMFDEWQANENFQLKTLPEYLMWQRSSKIFGWVAFLYIIWCLAVCVGDSLKVLFLSNTYQLTYPLWTPFNWQHPVYYWYVYVYELFAMAISCLSNITLDMFYCYMMQHLTLCFKLIAMRLENLNTKKFETNRNITERLVDIIKLDQKVKGMSQQCETIISYPILAQILLSAFIICFSLYRVHNVNFLQDPGNFFSSIQYAVAITLQIFLPCYYANQLTIASSSLSNAIYNCNWTEMSAYNRKLILLYMQYLQNPVIFTAGSFFEVGLPVFAKTINNAYSFFALLVNMNEG